MHDLGGVLVQSIEETELRDVCPRDEHVTLFLLVLGFGSRGRRERCSGEWGGHDVSFLCLFLFLLRVDDRTA